MSLSPTDILTSLQNGVVAINSMIRILNSVTSTSSGIVTIRLTTTST